MLGWIKPQNISSVSKLEFRCQEMARLTAGGAGVVRGAVLSNTAPAPDYLLLAATPRRSLAPRGRTPAAVPHAGSPPRLRTLPVPRNTVNNAWEEHVQCV